MTDLSAVIYHKIRGDRCSLCDQPRVPGRITCQRHAQQADELWRRIVDQMVAEFESRRRVARKATPCPVPEERNVVALMVFWSALIGLCAILATC